MGSAATHTGSVRVLVVGISVMSTTRIHAHKNFFQKKYPPIGEKFPGEKYLHRGTGWWSEAILRSAATKYIFILSFFLSFIPSLIYLPLLPHSLYDGTCIDNCIYEEKG